MKAGVPPAVTLESRATPIVLTLVAGLVALFVSYATAQPAFSDWSAPVNLGPVVNSTAGDTAPALSKDGRSLYFSSVREGGLGGNDLWVSQRNSADEPWGPPIHLGPVINTMFGDFQPSLSRDGHWLFFTSGRPGGLGSGDIWVSYREHVHDNFAWQPAVNLGPGINSPGNEQNPSFFENDDAGVAQLFFSRVPTDIYVSDLQSDGTFGPATLLPEFSSTGFDLNISVRFDGLEAFFVSNRPGSLGLSDVWTSTRRTVFDPWSAPTSLGPLVNSIAQDFDPEISSDRHTLYFGSNRAGGIGGNDLYMITRTRLRPARGD